MRGQDDGGAGLAQAPLQAIPEGLAGQPLELSDDGASLVYTFDTQHESTGIASLLRQLADHGIDFRDLHSSESSLEEIFVSLVRDGAPPTSPVDSTEARA